MYLVPGQHCSPTHPHPTDHTDPITMGTGPADQNTPL